MQRLYNKELVDSVFQGLCALSNTPLLLDIWFLSGAAAYDRTQSDKWRLDSH